MIYIIGTGPMAQDYAEVLLDMKQEFEVIGRGSNSARQFEEKTGVQTYIGGLESYIQINSFKESDSIIIATGTETLMSSLKNCLVHGAGKILIEKPAAISVEELLENKDFLEKYFKKVFVAYNRRFYASVKEVQNLILEDGGLINMHFEFTEWAHKIEPLEKAPGVKENWFFANSTHVVDLAFFLAGNPTDWHAYSKSGQLSWHDKTTFVGAGVTEKGVLFSYNSNWESAGRWAIELMTSKRRIYLKPLEGIQIQKKGSIQLENHTFDNLLEQKFKPGLYEQVRHFLTQEVSLKSLKSHIDDASIYNKILGRE
jgi:predicted dehydrogenase